MCNTGHLKSALFMKDLACQVMYVGSVHMSKQSGLDNKNTFVILLLGPYKFAKRAMDGFRDCWFFFFVKQIFTRETYSFPGK